KYILTYTYIYFIILSWFLFIYIDQSTISYIFHILLIIFLYILLLFFCFFFLFITFHFSSLFFSIYFYLFLCYYLINNILFFNLPFLFSYNFFIMQLFHQ